MQISSGGKTRQLEVTPAAPRAADIALDAAGEVILTPSPPSHPGTPLEQYAKDYSDMGVRVFLLDYVDAASDAIAVQTPFPTANRNHGLARISHQSRYASELTDLQTFARAFVPCIAESLSTWKQTPSLDEPGYWQKRVGHLYFSAATIQGVVGRQRGVFVS